MDLSIFGSRGRTSAEDERHLSKSWPSGSTESRTSDLWQSRQSRSAEAELHTFGGPGRDEMRKWPYPYLEVLAEQVRKMNEIFEVLAKRKYGKRNFRFLAIKTERNCGSKASDREKSWQSGSVEAELHIVEC